MILKTISTIILSLYIITLLYDGYCGYKESDNQVYKHCIVAFTFMLTILALWVG